MSLCKHCLCEENNVRICPTSYSNIETVSDNYGSYFLLGFGLGILLVILVLIKFYSFSRNHSYVLRRQLAVRYRTTFSLVYFDFTLHNTELRNLPFQLHNDSAVPVPALEGARPVVQQIRRSPRLEPHVPGRYKL